MSAETEREAFESLVRKNFDVFEYSFAKGNYEYFNCVSTKSYGGRVQPLPVPVAALWSMFQAARASQVAAPPAQQESEKCEECKGRGAHRLETPPCGVVTCASCRGTGVAPPALRTPQQIDDALLHGTEGGYTNWNWPNAANATPQTAEQTSLSDKEIDRIANDAGMYLNDYDNDPAAYCIKFGRAILAAAKREQQ